MLIDTSGFFSYLDGRDRFHEAAVDHLYGRGQKITHNYVLAELIPLCHSRRFDQSEAISFVDSIIDDPAFKILWIDRKLHSQAVALLTQRPDKAYSLCDAVSFVVMRQFGLTISLTTDHHFQQEGFFKLL